MNTSLAPAGRFADLQSFGDFLRAHRERRKISLGQIAADTKLIASKFESLERGDIDSLPTGLYRRAIVRAYASAIGLDPEETVADFQKLTVPQELPLPSPEQVQQNPRTSSWRLPSSFGSLAAGIAVGAVALTLPLWTTAPPPPEPHAAQVVTTTIAVHATPVATDGRDDVSGIDDVELASQKLIEPAAPPQVIPANTLSVTSDPPGGRVTVNGIGWGFTPLAIPHLPPGEKVIRVSKDGFSSTETTVMLTHDRPASLDVSLEPIAMAVEMPEAMPEEMRVETPVDMP